ncbi:MAG: GTPase HflX [Alphaproteobacteria bacterium]|nr:GTPase HflX [Alphaproteobacteria bacterium]
MIHPWLKRPREVLLRDASSCLEEAVGLAHAIDLKVVGAAAVPLAKPVPATLLGSGKTLELAQDIAEAHAGLAMVNDSLSPVQQRNLEKAWNCKVIDRTALILEIFGARARTHEGKLQVELAALEYQKGRLVRSWTHLERQRGGFGFMGGPGESQIEIDRRLIRDRIAKIKKQLEQVTRTRELHRKVRRETPYPVVALVGYTNAGKSTLFNKLTGAGVMAMDKLFATLDPTMRQLALPSGNKIILSDTVGFVSNLPTELVAAFRATLEEVLEADLLLHVRDSAHPDSQAQKHDVESVLKSLFKSEQLPDNVIEVRNKIDLLEVQETPEANGISAITGQGLDALLGQIDRELAQRFFRPARFSLSLSDGKALAWLHAHGNITQQEMDDDTLHLTVEMSEENIRRFEHLHHVTAR